MLVNKKRPASFTQLGAILFLEQTSNLAVLINGHVNGRRYLGQARHRHHVAG